MPKAQRVSRILRDSGFDRYRSATAFAAGIAGFKVEQAGSQVLVHDFPRTSRDRLELYKAMLSEYDGFEVEFDTRSGISNAYLRVSDAG